MRPRSVCKPAMAIMVLLGSSLAASAHDVWLTIAGEPAARRAIVNYGHPDDRPPALADKVVDLLMVTASAQKSLREGIGSATVSGLSVAQSKPFVDDGHALLAARYDNGFWTKTSEGTYRNAARGFVSDAVDSMWSVKFAKALTGPDAPWQNALGHDLEIVPLSDPDRTKPGQTLQVKVLFRGKPLAGAEVERGDGVTAVPEKDIPRFKTDGEGVASVPIVSAGAHLLVIDHKVTPSATPDQANFDMFNATLWFSTAPAATK